MGLSQVSFVQTPRLEIAYEQAGGADGIPVIVLHGFPYDVRSFDRVVQPVIAAGGRVFAPYLRGFGQTRFRDAATIRSGQQAALAQDLLDFMDALSIPTAVLAGYDWGGRAACIVSALWPERVIGLVSVGGYNVQDIASANDPSRPAWERTLWYQYYFQLERGRRALAERREELCKLLWVTWSPTWSEAADAFAASAPSLHNPDFVDVVIHSYRHRFGSVGGDPLHDPIEKQLSRQPPIAVSTVVLEGGADGIEGPPVREDRQRFTGPYRYHGVQDAGHNLPQQAPAAFASAITSLLA